MSKRNFILLVIVLVIVIIGVFAFLFSQKNSSNPTGSSSGTNFFSLLNPFGKSKTNPPPTTTNPPIDVSGGPTTPGDTTNPILKFVKVSSMPIAGFTVFSKERLKDVPIAPPAPAEATTTQTTTTTNISAPAKAKTPAKPTPPATEFAPALRYVDRVTGNVYQTFVDKLDEKKFTTTVIPKVYDAYFGNNGQSVVMRYLKDVSSTITTFIGTLPKEVLGADTTSTNEIVGAFLPDNVKDISISPDKSKAFYVFTTGDNMVGTTVNFSDSKKVQIFSSPFTEWLTSWSGNTGFLVSTKPSSGILGYTYKVDSVSKSLIKVLGGVNGLTALGSPDGKSILYGDNNLSLSLYNLTTKNSTLLGVRTLPEKCVWGKASDVLYCAVPKGIGSGPFPDSWYQGVSSFNDQIWKIDVTTGNTTMILDPSTEPNGEEIDGTKLSLDDAQNYLFFVNKKDSFLWEFKLN